MKFDIVPVMTGDKLSSKEVLYKLSSQGKVGTVVESGTVVPKPVDGARWGVLVQPYEWQDMEHLPTRGKVEIMVNRPYGSVEAYCEMTLTKEMLKVCGPVAWRLKQ